MWEPMIVPLIVLFVVVALWDIYPDYIVIVMCCICFFVFLYVSYVCQSIMWEAMPNIKFFDF